MFCFSWRKKKKFSHIWYYVLRRWFARNVTVSEEKKEKNRNKKRTKKQNYFKTSSEILPSMLNIKMQNILTRSDM